MKKYILILTALAICYSVSAQNLIESYKKGTIKLIPDETYAQGNDWEKVFETYFDTLYGKPMGNRKSIVLMPNGSVVVNHAYRNYYSKFDANGKFVKEFGITNKSGNKFKKTQSIHGVMNNNELFTGLDNMGNMVCMDFDGNYIKTLKLNYMTRSIIPLNKDKFAVVGWVIWKTKFRDFVAIVDYNTNEEKVIWDHFKDRSCDDNKCELFHYSYKFEKQGMFSVSTMPYTKWTGMSSPPIIECINNKLVMTLPTTGEIMVYDFNGELISKDKIEWATNYVSVDEQKEIQKNAIEKYKRIEEPKYASWVSREENKKAHETIIKQMEEDLVKIKDPIPIPVFSTVIKDSDDNLLFFEIPKEEGANKFNVWIYKDDGSFVCQSSFECDNYNLSITPSKLAFFNGYVYGLQTLKNTEGNPLRLVRFKISGI